MSLDPSDAARILRARLGTSINLVPRGPREGQENDKVLGFSATGDKVLALDRKIKGKTFIWIESKTSPNFVGVSHRSTPTINSNLNGRLEKLNNRNGGQVEVETEAALNEFLDWYDSPSRGAKVSAPAVSGLEAADFVKTQDAPPEIEDASRSISGIDASILAMRQAVENTVANSNGQVVERTVKNKELRMSSGELEKLIASLLDQQGKRCILTGIPFQFDDLAGDKNLSPSVDRIDSNGHYEVGNLQIVCRFINFWKSDSDNEEFKRLLMLVRGWRPGNDGLYR
jgi:hypothetical protein